MLDLVSSHSVVLVCAPAGSGKSVLLAEWARECDFDHVAWMTCTAGAATPAAFWSVAAAALARAGVDRSHGVDPPALPGVPSRRSEVLDALVRWLESIPGRVALVCDDFQEIGDAATHRDLQYVIDRLPPQLTLVLITRSYPPLTIHRARVEDRLVVIRGSDLAFTATETEQLLARHGVALAESDLQILQDRTRGWAAGIRLALISMVRAADPAEVVRQLAGSTDAVSGYLTEEVLSHLDANDRAFFMSTCVVDVLTGPLVDALVTDGGGMERLADVADRVGFLHRIPEPPFDRYAYHPMFAELLRRQLLHRDPEAYARQHRACAAWFERRGEPMAAIRHAAESASWDLAARVAVCHLVSLVMRGRIPELSQIVAAFPHDFATTDGRVLLVSALSAALCNEPDRARRLLERAEPTLSPRMDLPARRARAVASYLRSLLARIDGDPAAVLAAATAEGPDVPGPDDTGFVPADLDLRAAWRSSRAAALLWDDQLSEALRCAVEACDDVRAGAGGWPMVTGLGVIALALALEGRLTAAQQAIDELAQFVTVRDWSDAPYVAIADFASAWVALERGDVAGADYAVSAAEIRLQRLAGSFPAVMIAILRARIAAVTADGPQTAHSLLSELPRLRGLRAALPHRLANLVDVECALAAADVSGALARTADDDALRAVVAARSGDPDVRFPTAHDAGSRLRFLLALALTRHRAGDRTGADRVLDQALELTALEGFRLPYRQLGEPIRQVLVDAPYSALRHGQLIADLLADGSPHGFGADLVDPLSARELDVLRHLVAGRDTDEIAGDLFVSRNTVRTHTKNIYRKLAVQNRKDAVLRAGALGLI